MRNIFLVIGIMICSSCSSWKNQLHKTGDKDFARMNAIIDFSFANRLVANKAFVIDNYEESEQLYCFQFNKNEKSLLRLTDSIGGYPTASFPNKYIEKNNKLFLWNEPGAKITAELIHIMNKYKSIDSSYYMIPDYLPIINTGDFKKEMFYFICKNEIYKYKKVKAIWVDVEDYPNIECTAR